MIVYFTEVESKYITRFPGVGTQISLAPAMVVKFDIRFDISLKEVVLTKGHRNVHYSKYLDIVTIDYSISGRKRKYEHMGEVATYPYLNLRNFSRCGNEKK